MSATVFFTVLFAAVLHACWNALVKGGIDKTVSMTAVVIGQGVTGALLIPFAPALDWAACWPYLATGVGLHIGYQSFLIVSYRLGDLTQVYPIARGVAPLLIAAASFLFYGVTFAPAQIAAVTMISLGIASISLVRRADGLFQGKAALAALTTGVFIASYSIVDGYGARLGGSAVGYFGWLSLMNAGIYTLAIAFWRPATARAALLAWRPMVLGGGASFAAYALVVWAFMQAPIALVSALRETSIIFALFIGVFLMGERLSLAKVAATAMTLGGAVLLRVYRN